MSGVFVEVEVDEYEIKQAGYHHEDDCPANKGRDGKPNPPTDKQQVEAALEAMHDEHHADQSCRIERCLAEPCRSVYRWGDPGLRAV